MTVEKRAKHGVYSMRSGEDAAELLWQCRRDADEPGVGFDVREALHADKSGGDSRRRADELQGAFEIVAKAKGAVNRV